MAPLDLRSPYWTWSGDSGVFQSVLSFKTRGNLGELLPSLSLLILKMEMMQTDPWLPPRSSLGFVVKVSRNDL